MLKSLCFLILITIAFLVGCVDQTGLKFQVAPGLELSVKDDVDEYSDRRVYRFVLERPVVVQTSGRAIILEFPAEFTKADLKVMMSESMLLERVLDGNFALGFATGFKADDSARTVAFSVPLEPGMRFDGFELLYSGKDHDIRDALPVFAGLEDAVAGVIFEPSPLLDTRINVSTRPGNPHTALVFDIARLNLASDGIIQIALDYTYTSDTDDPAHVSLFAGNAGDSAGFDVRLRKGGTTLYLYEGVCGFVPESIEVRVEGGGFSLSSMTVGTVSRDNGDRLEAIPIDMGGVIGYSSDQWRTKDFELFSWNLYPEILIIDTISYAVQSHLFKRLAFFVEKTGSAGTLLPNEILEGKHGWNAHDYRAEDLARFFSSAAIEAFPLGETELHLREILNRNGVIREADGTWLPGEGGLISLSQETPTRLRKLFMVHEGYHGILFSDVRYQELSFSIWDNLSTLEQWFWREFLQLREYNAHDEYLVVNEFQAYLMQVPRENLDAYYWDYTVPGLVKAVPRTASLVVDLETYYPDTFHRSAEMLEVYLLEEAGIGAADLLCLQARE